MLTKTKKINKVQQKHQLDCMLKAENYQYCIFKNIKILHGLGDSNKLYSIMIR